MRKFLSNSSIIAFFCFVMGCILSLDSVLTVAEAMKLKGISAEFSDYTVRFSVLQAQSEDSYTQSELLAFIEEREDSILNISKVNTSENCSEVFTMQKNKFYYKDRDVSGVFLSAECYDSFKSGGESLYQYEMNYYTVLGTYADSETSESFLADLLYSLKTSPDTAVNGVYYIDCGGKTAEVYGELETEIMSKNPYCQLTLLEDGKQGYLLMNISESMDSIYYVLQLVLLLILGLINFSNISGYWIQTRTDEILVRKLSGGVPFGIYIIIIVRFLIITALFTALGMAVGLCAGKMVSKVYEGAFMLMAFFAAALMTLLFILGSLVLIKKVNMSFVDLKKARS